MTRLLVTGAGGMLGRDLVAVLAARRDLKVTAATRADLDITDRRGGPRRRRRARRGDQRGRVDRRRRRRGRRGRGDRGQRRRAWPTWPRPAPPTDARLIHVSTDYVFAGDAHTPYPEDAPTAPVNAYGRGKLVGEQAVARLLPDTGYVVRTAWLYGAHGPNFVATMLRLAAQREHLDVVDDQHGQPTWSYALAERLVALADAALAGHAAPGVYHGTCAGQTTWYGLARAAFTLAGLDPDRIRPTTSDRYPRPAPRPAYSVLGHSRWAAAGLPPLPDWHSALVDAFHSPAPPAPWKVA